MTMPRETGAEKAQASCSICGGPVPVIETAYGSTAPGPCPKCYPTTSRESAAETVVPRETGTSTSSTTSVAADVANEGSQGGES